MPTTKRKFTFSKKELDRAAIDKKRIERGKRKESERELVRVQINFKTWVYCEPGQEAATKLKWEKILSAKLEFRKSGGVLPLKKYGLPKKKR
jgi:hypothetical protein